ncbi:hypothetical protein BCO26_2808 [Heyndrickxia coagulans 2-6]|nr:hypothetical protein BCO26_2808 [Heyndrickxia coagulans 2-6]
MFSNSGRFQTTLITWSCFITDCVRGRGGAGRSAASKTPRTCISWNRHVQRGKKNGSPRRNGNFGDHGSGARHGCFFGKPRRGHDAAQTEANLLHRFNGRHFSCVDAGSRCFCGPSSLPYFWPVCPVYWRHIACYHGDTDDCMGLQKGGGTSCQPVRTGNDAVCVERKPGQFFCRAVTRHFRRADCCRHDLLRRGCCTFNLARSFDRQEIPRLDRGVRRSARGNDPGCVRAEIAVFYLKKPASIFRLFFIY